MRVMKMEMKNLKLFMVNQSIIEENEKVGQKGLLAASPRESGPVISAPNKALSTTETATTITKMNIYCFLQKLIRRIGRNRGLCSLIFGLWS